MRFYLLFLIILLQSCGSDSPPKNVTKAFYYWKSIFQLSSQERKTLDSCGVNKLYIKAFDIDWNFATNKPVLKAPVIFQDSIPQNLALVPVIFITNQTLKQISDTYLDDFANYVQSQLKHVWSVRPYIEIQFDCDWTISTRTKYFKFLDLYRKHCHGKTLSATIRLHQIKFAHKTGIPPVDRGMLMFYNMSDWKKPKIKNSIYDLDAASQYTATLSKYPLDLDIVFPLFRWAVIYRGNRFMTVINKLGSETLNRQEFLKKEGNKYYVQKDVQAFGISLRRGDMIRAEDVDYEELLKGSRALSKQISTQKLTFAFYYLDRNIVSNYTHEQLHQIFLSFELPD
ncbi:hypothetical protein [Emticicia sp. C21]|uniref:hypothetical protein n=1 Tax=Emticicia sp. C21 TaxID=2302915 RepID=UPI000E34B3A6|nr:hypothetical protein [Emticicia sp. C21]RFS16429.1 hypothetical protein D0T08_12145 [Emticicia sp. C21]